MTAWRGWGVVGLVVGLAGLACQTQVSKDAHQAVASGARLVDVRTAEEYAGGHVEGAINIPVAQVASRLAEIGPPTTPVVVYCRSGARSAAAAQTLRAAGYDQVLDLGAMGNW